MRATGERARNPLAVQRLAWALTGNLDVDQSTGARPRVPGRRRGEGRRRHRAPASSPTDETYATLTGNGCERGRCTPAD